jgi:hypothetical protein
MVNSVSREWAYSFIVAIGTAISVWNVLFIILTVPCWTKYAFSGVKLSMSEDRAIGNSRLSKI